MDYDSDGEPILSAEKQQQAKQAARRHEAHGGGLCLNRPPSTPKASSLSPPQLSASQLSPSALQKGEKAMRYAMRMEEQIGRQPSVLCAGDATHKRQGVRLSIQNKIWLYHFLY